MGLPITFRSVEWSHSHSLRNVQVCDVTLKISQPLFVPLADFYLAP